MFTKHVYTCPDVIHITRRTKKITYSILGAEALIFVAMLAAGWLLEKQDKKDARYLKAVPNN